MAVGKWPGTEIMKVNAGEHVCVSSVCMHVHGV